MPRYLGVRKHENGDKPWIPVQQLSQRITAVTLIAGWDKVPFDSVILCDGPDEGLYSVDAAAFKDDVDSLDRLCTEASSRLGKMTIRFLGDLKEQTYPLDTILFNATKDDSHDLDLRTVIRNAILTSTGEHPVRMVNLANVRDIVIVPGNPDPEAQKKIAYVVEMVALFRQWLKDGEEIAVEHIIPL